MLGLRAYGLGLEFKDSVSGIGLGLGLGLRSELGLGLGLGLRLGLGLPDRSFCASKPTTPSSLPCPCPNMVYVFPEPVMP